MVCLFSGVHLPEVASLEELEVYISKESDNHKCRHSYLQLCEQLGEEYRYIVQFPEPQEIRYKSYKANEQQYHKKYNYYDSLYPKFPFFLLFSQMSVPPNQLS